MKKLLITLLFVLIASNSWATKVYWWNATSTIGGADGSLDSINGQNLANGDKCLVVTPSGKSYLYNLDVDSALTEDSTYYAVVSPDSNAGDKRWILQWSGGRVLIGDSTIDQGDSTIVGTLAWHIADAAGPADITALPGTYLFTTGVDTSTYNDIKIVGSGTYNTIFTAGSKNINVITFGSGRQCGLKNVRIYNQYIADSASALITLDGSVECVIEDVFLIGGYRSVWVTGGAADNVLSRIIAYAQYEDLFKLEDQAGTYVQRCKLDNPWPVATPAVANNKGAWAGATGYDQNDFVITGGFYLQCKTAGTSAGGAPTVLAYGNDITDGTAVWRLAGSSTASGITIDSDSFYTIITETDISGTTRNGINLVDTGATAPQKTIINKTEIAAVEDDIRLTAGTGVIITENTLSGTKSTTGNGIYTLTSFIGDLTISENIILIHNIGIQLGSGINTLISSNQIAGCTGYGIYIDAGITHFNISNNALGASTTWGVNAVTVAIATGASDYYHVVNNIFNGASAGIDDNGTGSNKTISGNQ